MTTETANRQPLQHDPRTDAQQLAAEIDAAFGVEVTTIFSGGRPGYISHIALWVPEGWVIPIRRREDWVRFLLWGVRDGCSYSAYPIPHPEAVRLGRP